MPSWIRGTCYFLSEGTAVRYYRKYVHAGEPLDDVIGLVRGKIDAGEIHIGKPVVGPGEEVFYKPEEGRYFIREV